MEKEKVKSGNIIDFKVLGRIMEFVRPYKAQFYFVVLLTFLLGVLTPMRPYLIQYTLDKHVQFGNYDGMVKIMLLIFGLLIIQAAAEYVHTFISGRIAQYVIRDIRVKVYEHIVNLRLKFFDSTPIGRLVTRTISDVEALADVFSEKIKVAFNDVRNAVSNLNAFVQEHISGMSIVQIFGSEKREFENFKEINREHRDANLKSVLYYSVYYPLAEIIAAMGMGLLIWYGAKAAINQEITGISIGKLTAFIMYIQLFFRPIRMIADRYNTLQMGIVSSS